MSRFTPLGIEIHRDMCRKGNRWMKRFTSLGIDRHKDMYRKEKQADEHDSQFKKESKGRMEDMFDINAYT